MQLNGLIYCYLTLTVLFITVLWFQMLLTNVKIYLLYLNGFNCCKRRLTVLLTTAEWVRLLLTNANSFIATIKWHQLLQNSVIYGSWKTSTVANER